MSSKLAAAWRWLTRCAAFVFSPLRRSRHPADASGPTPSESGLPEPGSANADTPANGGELATTPQPPPPVAGPAAAASAAPQDHDAAAALPAPVARAGEVPQLSAVTSTPAAGPSRQVLLRRHLDRILASPPPANHSDHRQMADYGTRDHAAAFRQLDQVRILQLLHGCDEVAAVYCEWLGTALREQAKTARPLQAWDELALDSAPIGWDRDRHGFLCWCCGDAFWQVIPVGDSDRLCGRCARRELNLKPGQVWAPRLPAADGHIASPGLLPGEPFENEIELPLSDGTSRRYGLGDAGPFLLPDGWMNLTADRYLASGEADRPRMEITGSTAREGHRFSFMVALGYDPSPQGWRQAPYGFRYTTGTLTGPGAARAFTDPVSLLDTIALGEQAFAGPPAAADAGHQNAVARAS